MYKHVYMQWDVVYSSPVIPSGCIHNPGLYNYIKFPMSLILWVVDKQSCHCNKLM